MNKISVIIPSYKRALLLEQILSVLVIQQSILEILVIDSQSNDGTKEIVSKYNQNSKITIKHFDVENNVSLKRNKGILEANTDNLIFLDDDCIPDNNFVEHHLNSLLNDPNSVHCGNIFFPEDKVMSSNYIRYKESRHLKYRYEFNQSNLDFRTITTMNMSINKKIILENNLYFREDFIGYGMEDNEFGCQVSDAHILIKRCKASITHMENNDPLLFAKKIFHTSRDGVYKLKTVNREAVMDLPYSYFFELDYVHKSLLEKILVYLIRPIFSIKIAQVVLRFMKLIDHYSLLYFPFGFKYIFASYYYEGIKKRIDAYKSTTEVSKSWYSDNVK